MTVIPPRTWTTRGPTSHGPDRSQPCTKPSAGLWWASAGLQTLASGNVLLGRQGGCGGQHRWGASEGAEDQRAPGAAIRQRPGLPNKAQQPTALLRRQPSLTVPRGSIERDWKAPQLSARPLAARDGCATRREAPWVSRHGQAAELLLSASWTFRDELSSSTGLNLFDDSVVLPSVGPIVEPSNEKVPFERETAPPMTRAPPPSSSSGCSSSSPSGPPQHERRLSRDGPERQGSWHSGALTGRHT